MKKLIPGLAILALITVFAVRSQAAMPTAHDLSGAYGTLTGAELNDGTCMYCHVPHNAVADTPLWASKSGAAITLRDAGSIDSDSAFCMSCHDGVTAIGGTQAMIAKDLGQDLTDDHPISVTWAAGGAAGALSQSAAETNLGLSAGDLATLTCSSCHDAHGANSSMLRVTSGLCVDCHSPALVGQ